MTLLLMAMISVFDAAVVASKGFGEKSNAPPNARQRSVSLALTVKGELASMLGGLKNMWAALKGPFEPLAQNNHVPPVVWATVLVTVLVSTYLYAPFGVLPKCSMVPQIIS